MSDLLRWLWAEGMGCLLLVGKETDEHMPGNRTAWSDGRRRCAKQGDSHRTADRGYQTHRQARSLPTSRPRNLHGRFLFPAPVASTRLDSLTAGQHTAELPSLVLQQVAVDRHSQSVRPNFQHISAVVLVLVTGGGRGEPATNPAWLVWVPILRSISAPPLSTTHSTTTITAPYPASPST